jgi:hypothetical protein
LERNPAVEEDGPLNTHLHPCSHFDLLMGRHQDAVTVQILDYPCAMGRRPVVHITEAKAQALEISKAVAPIRSKRPVEKSVAGTLR